MGFATVFSGCVTLFLLFGWLRELRFYRKRNWDRTIDSRITRGGFGAGGAVTVPFTPKIRVLIASPLFLLMGFCLTTLWGIKYFGG